MTTTIILKPTGSDATGNGTDSAPLRTLQGVRDRGLLVANTTVRAQRGGTYGPANIGAAPVNFAIEASPGTGPKPVFDGISAYAASPWVPGFRLSDLAPTGTNYQGTGIDLLNRGDTGGTGFDAPKLERNECSMFDLGIGIQTAHDQGRHRGVILDGNFLHDNGTCGGLLGGFDDGEVKNNVLYNNGHHSTRAADQSQGWYGQAHYARKATGIRYYNNAVLDTAGASFRGTAGKDPGGIGATMSFILAMVAGTHVATEEGFVTGDHILGIQTRDPDPANGKKNGCGLHLDHVADATVSFSLFTEGGNGVGPDASAGENIHALQPDGCQRVTFQDVVVYGYRKGDCWGESNSGPGAGSLIRCRFIQPDGDPFTNGGAPISANWQQTPAVEMSRARIADHRATIARVCAFAGVPNLRGLAAWFAADPTRIKQTIVWAMLPYFVKSADMNHDGVVGPPDFPAFQNAWAAGSMDADFDGDGRLTVNDFAAYMNAYAAQRN